MVRKKPSRGKPDGTRQAEVAFHTPQITPEEQALVTRGKSAGIPSHDDDDAGYDEAIRKMFRS
jgi:hypothetical protein